MHISCCWFVLLLTQEEDPRREMTLFVFWQEKGIDFESTSNITRRMYSLRRERERFLMLFACCSLFISVDIYLFILLFRLSRLPSFLKECSTSHVKSCERCMREQGTFLLLSSHLRWQQKALWLSAFILQDHSSLDGKLFACNDLLFLFQDSSLFLSDREIKGDSLWTQDFCSAHLCSSRP